MPRMVMIAGPNPVDIVYTYELGEIFQDFNGSDEVALWMPTPEGELEKIETHDTLIAADDKFYYYSTTLTFPDGSEKEIDWDKRKVY